MHKKLKVIIAITLATMLTSQISAIQGLTVVKAATPSNVITTSADASLGGFKLESKKWVEELNCNAYIYTHPKSGANVLYLDKNNDDKMMGIAFRTPTRDNTGVNHVIEHSVLCGSKKYPVKDALDQLGKTSMSTYLNAMTSNEGTIYPISSRNDKDFQNLMNVYLDAVFYPNVLKDKRIFEQEAIRYQLNTKDDELKLNGIVYSEMKGNYSNPAWTLNKATEEALFPDTSYKYESGGLPEDMANLTYEHLVKTYNQNYHPSNSLIYLYGKMNINEKLKFIGENYLNNFDKKEFKPEIQIQQQLSKRADKTVEYSVAKGTPIDNKTIFSLNYAVDKSTNVELVQQFNFLALLLLDSSNSPLKKTLKDNGFGESIVAMLDNSHTQNVFKVLGMNLNENQKDKFQKIVQDSLKDISEKGFDEELINSIYKKNELGKRMITGDMGIKHLMSITNNWIHGGDPLAYLTLDSKQKYTSSDMQNLIKKYLLDNSHSAMITLKPVEGLEEKKEAELKNKLDKYKSSLSKEQIDEIVKNTNELKTWQSTPSTKEELATLPTLTRNDINKTIKDYKVIEKEENGVKILQHPTYTNGLDYIFFYFDSSTVPQDKLGYLYLLNSLLTNIDTKNYSKEKLSQQIMINCGGINFQNSCVNKSGDRDNYTTKMSTGLITLNENLPKSFELLQEVMFNSKLDDKARIKEVIKENKLNAETMKSMMKEGIASARVIQYMSESGRYSAFENEGFYNFICDLDKNFDKNSDEVVKNLQQVRDLVFNKQDMVVSFIGSEDSYKNFTTNFNSFSKCLKDEKLKKQKYTFDNSAVNEGLIIPSKVQYVAKGGDLKKAGYVPNGKLPVLQNILSSDYLWQNIRVKGGAYGAGMDIVDGNIVFSSFRDPNLKETVDTFNKIPEFLKNFKADEKQMDSYIISAAAKQDNALNMLGNILGPVGDSVIADGLYISGTKASDLQKQREELINTTEDDIRSFAPVMDAVLKQNYICVVGGETEIQKNSKNFVTIKDAMNSKNEKSRIVDMEKKNNSPINKSWSVKFSKDLDPVTVNTANIYVLDEQNHQVKVKVSYDKNNKSIKVEPETSYEKGKKYNLFIKDISSIEEDGKVSKLIAPMKMEFTTEK